HAGARSASGQATVEMDHTTYFDTADRVLRKAGFTLRVRHRNASQGQPEEYLQTVKSANDGTYRRDEWEWPIAAPWPDLGHLREVGALAAIGPGRDFEPIFHTEVRRTRLLVTPAPGAKIAM